MLGARLMFNGLMYMRESTYIKVYTYTYTYYTYTYTYIYILFMVFCIIYLEICYACIYNCLFRIVMHSCHVFFWYWFWFFKFVSVGLCTIPCELMSICKHIVIYIYTYIILSYSVLHFYICIYIYIYTIYIAYDNILALNSLLEDIWWINLRISWNCWRPRRGDPDPREVNQKSGDWTTKLLWFAFFVLWFLSTSATQFVVAVECPCGTEHETVRV